MKAAIMKRPEDALQRSVLAHVRMRGVPNLFVCHIPNGGLRSKIEAAIMKGLGVRAGVPDLLFILDSRAYLLELKAEGEKPSPVQVATANELSAAGARVGVADNIDSAIAQLECWGLLRENLAVWRK
jgi:hypothetical protein